HWFATAAIASKSQRAVSKANVETAIPSNQDRMAIMPPIWTAAVNSASKFRSRLLGLCLLDRFPDVVRRRRHGDVADAVDRERIPAGPPHYGWRRGGAALAARLDTERIGGREHFRNFGHE